MICLTSAMIQVVVTAYPNYCIPQKELLTVVNYSRVKGHLLLRQSDTTEDNNLRQQIFPYHRLLTIIYTTLFPKDMIQDINVLHWNIIHESIGVA